MTRILGMNDKQVPSYPLRMPPDLREQLTLAAQQNHRSVNAEIIARLQNSLVAGSAEGARRLDPDLRDAMAASLADVAVRALTQDEAWKEDVARRVTQALRQTSFARRLKNP